MIAVDTNILVYAHREDSNFHRAAKKCLTELAEGGQNWGIPWPCLHEFIAIVTHPKIYLPPTPLADALVCADCWLESPTLNLLSETEDYWTHLKPLAVSGKIAGAQIHDARVAALCLQNNVKTLWSADRDFTRFKQLKVFNPLI